MQMFSREKEVDKMPEFKDHPADPSYQTQIIVYRLKSLLCGKNICVQGEGTG